MKKFRKLIALMCACLFITALPGCSSTDSETKPGGTGKENTGAGNGGEDMENAKGRFLETELELPEKINTVIGVRKCQDGSIVLIGYDENYVGLYRECTKNRGKDWEETALDSGGYNMAAINEDGSAALFGYSAKEDRNALIVEADGTSRKLALQMPEYKGSMKDTSNMIISAEYAAGKLFLVDLNLFLYEADTTSGKMTEISKKVNEDIIGVLPLGNRLALLTGNGVRIYDDGEGRLFSEDKELEKALGVISNDTDTPVYQAMLTTGEKEDELYYVNHGGIFYHKYGGSTIEQLANGELISIGDRSMSFRELVRFDDEHFMVFAVDSLGKERCYSYMYDANVSAVPEKQLDVYALEDSTVLQQVVSAFQKNNPDVFVKKTIGMSGDDSVTAEDAIKTLNTEIMAGNGPDVLVLDGLPVDSYVEKGILSDISSLVADADKKEGLFTNITDAYKKDGAVYQIPLRFFCTGAEWKDGLKEISGTPGQAAEYVKTLKDEKTLVLPNFPAEMILYAFYDAYSASWKTENGIDAESLRSSLESVKTLYDLDGYKEDERNSYGSVFSDTVYQGQIIFGTLTQGCDDRIMGKAQLTIGTLSSVDNVRHLYGLESSKPGSFGLLYGEEKQFVPFVSLGLAESAKDNEMAQDFIRLSLSANGQRQMTNSFSINKKAYENECNSGKAYSIGGSDQDGNMFGYEVRPLNETQIKNLTAMLESLDTPAWSDRVVQDLVISEGKKYLQGEQSLEDAVSAITRKVQLYVSE